MNGLKGFWANLGRSARLGFAAGVLAIVIMVSVFGYLVLKTDYGVLFSDLAATDLATMAGELDKMKVPYRIGPDGNSLMVPESLVHKTRVSLMGRELPLHGAVGFELFNNMEFGVSDFVQKVNYQRALQGELTRTILAIDEVQSVRVHLALAEQALFRREAGRSKASVTVVTKPGRTLQPTQVQGIQRLIAASVTEVQAQDVTVLDQHGVALSRSGQGDTSTASDGALLLDLKRSVEGYLAQKASKVLDRLFGVGQSVVSVDAVFSQEQTRITTEEVLAAKGGDGAQSATGVVLRERQTSRDSGDAGAGRAPQVTSQETDYQTGKRTEQVMSPAGTLKQLSVAVVVKKPLPEAELQRVRDLVATAVGLNRVRGDVVTVHSMEQLQESEVKREPPIAASVAAPAAPATVVLKPRDAAGSRPWTGVAAVGLVALLGGLLLGTWVRARFSARRLPALSDVERDRMLQTVQGWLAQEPVGRDLKIGAR